MQPQRQLSVFDSVCIIVGIIIGAGIYENAPTVAACMGSPAGTLGIWIVGGLLALCGALCYAELATAYPRAGGDYVYLTRAFGAPAGFLFGWSQLAIVRPGDIALMAFIFARYAGQLWSPLGAGAATSIFWAASIIIVLTAINVLGVRQGKLTQNVLTVTKAVGILAIIAAAFTGPGPSAQAAAAAPNAAPFLTPKLALILVLFTYGGWNEMAYVAAEVRDPRRGILRALLIGTLAVLGLYILINIAFLLALGYAPMTRSEAIAVDVMARAFPGLPAGRIIAALICISAAGAVNGLTFTGARITYAVGADHALFRKLGRWHPRLVTPVWALATQGGIALAIVLFAGSFIKTIITTAPVFWIFLACAALSLFVLRLREPAIDRPFRVPIYPLVPLIFFASCLFMFWSSLTYAWGMTDEAGHHNMRWGLALMAGVLVIGGPVYLISGLIQRTQSTPVPDSAVPAQTESAE